jgi:5-methylthioribose kinase
LAIAKLDAIGGAVIKASLLQAEKILDPDFSFYGPGVLVQG